MKQKKVRVEKPATIYNTQLWGLQELMQLNAGNNKFFMKSTDWTFGSFKNFEEFYSIWSKDINREMRQLYEYIPAKNKTLLYWDIDSYGNKNSLKAFINSMYYFIKENIPYLFPSNMTREDFKGHLIITHNQRTKMKIDKNKHSGFYDYYSFHVIYRNEKNPLYCYDLRQQQYFVNYYLIWANSLSKYKQEELKIGDLFYSDPTDESTKCCVDYNPYKTPFQAIRMPYSSKSGHSTETVLRPIKGCRSNNDIRLAFIQYLDDTLEHTKFEVPESWIKKVWAYENNPSARKCTNSPPVQISMPSGIPEYITNQAVKYFKEYHPKGELVDSKIDQISKSYIFKFIDKHNTCRIHDRIHEDMTNNNYNIFYNANGDYLYWCWSCQKPNEEYRPIKLEKKKNLVTWDYEYTDRNEIVCDPLISPDDLTEGSTQVLQSEMGTGKTEATIKMLEKLPEKTSILHITFRRTMAAKFKKELEQFNFVSYLDSAITEVDDLNRYIVCLDSICKPFRGQIRKPQYDIVLIDEIFSVLEHFDSNLMNKNRTDIMMVFEHYVSTCKYLYVMDANIDNNLVVKSINNLRDPKKSIFKNPQIIWHRNWQRHDYTDYILNWYETTKIENKPDIILEVEANETDKKIKDKQLVNFELKILDKLDKGKKIYVPTSSKKWGITLADLVINKQETDPKFPKFKILIYTADTPSEEKNEQLGDVHKYWGKKLKKSVDNISYYYGASEDDVKLVIASPTISTGINYCDDNPLSGFHEIFAYARTGYNTATFNTLCQQLRRNRICIDKTISIIFDNNIIGYGVTECDIISTLYNRTDILYKHLPPTYAPQTGLNPSDGKPIYDTQSLPFIIWLENQKNKIKYSNPLIVKNTIQEHYSNNPKNPETPGFGMKWVDHSTGCEATIEQVEKHLENKKKVIASRKEFDTNYFMQVPEITHTQFVEIGDKFKVNKEVTRQELAQYQLYHLEMDYKIDFNGTRKNWDTMEDSLKDEFIKDFTKIKDIMIKNIYNRHKLWNNENINITNYKDQIAMDDHYKLNDMTLNDNLLFTNKYDIYSLPKGNYKDATLPHTIEALWNKGSTIIPVAVELCKMLQLKPFTDLDGTTIDRELFEELLSDKNRGNLKKFWNDCISSHRELKTSSKKANDHTKQFTWLQDLHRDNNTKWLYDYSYDELKDNINSFKSNLIPELKESEWVRVKNMIPVEREKYKSEGKMSIEKLINMNTHTSEMKSGEPDWWEYTQAKTEFSKILKQIGYKFKSDRENGAKSSGVTIEYNDSIYLIHKYKKIDNNNNNNCMIE